MKRKNRQINRFVFSNISLDSILKGWAILWHFCQEINLTTYTVFRLFFPKKDGRRKSHPLSKFLRTWVEKKELQKAFGITMTSLVLLTNFIIRPTSAFDVINEEKSLLTQPEEEVLTVTVFAKPLEGRVCQGFHRWHPAIDICAPLNTPIKAIAKGQVTEASYSRLGWGNTVVVKHIINDKQYWSRYAHLKKINVQINQEVDKETVLGTIGMSGWTTGPHLHLELREKNGHPVNPAEYLPTFNYLLANKKG